MNSAIAKQFCGSAGPRRKRAGILAKKILSILPGLAMLGCAALAEPAEEVSEKAAPAVGERLGFALLRELYSAGENRVISPASLTLALGMAAEGAAGETLTEILSALDAQDVSQLAGVVPEGIESANAAFVAPGVALKGDYAERLEQGYGAERFEIDAEVVGKVNAWVKEHTGGLIDRLLSEAPDPDTGLVLVNAIAMDAKWEKPFEPQNTVEEAFHAPDGDVDVEMMYQRDSFDYVEKDGLQIIRLPYAQGDAGEGALEMWTAEGMAWLKEGAESTEVDLFLPKMDVSYGGSLAGALKVLGVEAAFGDGADFSGIANVPMKVADILQKTRVQLDEEGTKAAAATALIMECMAARPVENPPEVRVDRPFAFAIADGETGTICFAGAIENPEAA